jgi:hypothetical protein
VYEGVAVEDVSALHDDGHVCVVLCECRRLDSRAACESRPADADDAIRTTKLAELELQMGDNLSKCIRLHWLRCFLN